MSKTKLMKIGPARSHVYCRGRGKFSGKNGVRSGAVKKKKKEPRNRYRILRKELMNPAKETMIPISHQDFVKMGYLSYCPDVDYKLCKYHEQLVYSGTTVTPNMLRARVLEICKESGRTVTDHVRKTEWITNFLTRCGRFRAAKSRGLPTDTKSLWNFNRVFQKEMEKLKPYNSITEQRLAPRCTCQKSRPKAQSSKMTTAPSLFTLFDTSTSEVEDTTVGEQENSVQETTLLNLFALPPDMASTSTAKECSSSNQDGQNKTELCNYCRHRNRRPRSSIESIKYSIPIYEFPELLPSKTKNGYKDTFDYDIASFSNDCDAEISECDGAFSELFDQFQGFS